MTAGLAASQLNAFLDALCKAASFTSPAGFFVKLHLGDPGAAGTANAAANTTRKSTSFASGSGGANATNADIVWTSVPNTETYSFVSFWSAVSAGTFIGSCALTSSRAVTAGDTFTIPSGSVTLAITPVAA